MEKQFCVLSSPHPAGHLEVANVGRIYAHVLWNRFEMHDVAEKFADGEHTYIVVDILFRAYRRGNWKE